MPGCWLLTSSQVALGLVNSAGVAVWSTAVPTATGLVGASLYTQGVATSPAANALGAVTSNGCTVTIGSR